MAIIFRPSASNPAELIRIRQELADMDLTRSQLRQQIDSRIKLAQTLKSEQFYIAIDTSKQKFTFRFGSDVVREANAVIGAGKAVASPDGKTWTFVPVKGAFTVAQKQTGYSWRVPAWVYAMRNEAPPADPRSIANGLGKYVLVLPNDYVIHTPPPPDSPLAGSAKPGSIMIPEADLEAVWPRIVNGQTRVYIF